MFIITDTPLRNSSWVNVFWDVQKMPWGIFVLGKRVWVFPRDSSWVNVCWVFKNTPHEGFGMNVLLGVQKIHPLRESSCVTLCWVFKN